MNFEEFKYSLHDMLRRGGVTVDDPELPLNKEYYLLENFYKQIVEVELKKAVEDERKALQDEISDEISSAISSYFRSLKE